MDGRIARDDVAARIATLGPGERLTLIGLGRDEVGQALRAASAGARGALLLEGRQPTAERIVGQLLNDLAELALARWPDWNETGAFQPWLRAARRRASAGHRPRFRRMASQVEFVQLMQVLEPNGPVLVAGIDPVEPGRAAPMVQALEWSLTLGASVVAAFAAEPPPLPPYDRVLYGALAVVGDPEPAQRRFIAPGGRPHPASESEQRVEAALLADGELGALFLCNQLVPILGPGTPPRVDLLWPAGKVVVELDGPEHQDDPNFGDDRHRDYELLVAGYLVLRLTNEQVATDLQRAVEKIRDVVRFRRSTGLV